MENKKRHPIRKRIYAIVLVITAVSLIATSAFGIISMFGIQEKSEKALTDQLQNNLTTLMTEKSAEASLQFDKYIHIVSDFTDYLHDILTYPDKYKPQPVYKSEEVAPGTLCTQMGRATKDVDVTPYLDFRDKMGNTAILFKPAIVANRSTITATYWGFTNNLVFSFDDMPEIKGPYDDFEFDYFNTAWYMLAEEKREVCFTDLYTDTFGRGLNISCVGPIYDGNNEFVGALGMDILVGDLYDKIVDMDLGNGAYAFIVDRKGNVVSPDPDKETEQKLAGFNGLDEETANRIINEHDGLFTYNNAYYAFSTIDNVGWTLCTYMPESLVLKPVQNIGNDIISSVVVFLIFFLIIIVIVLLALYTLSGTITKPIIDLTKDVGEISGGNLDHRAAIQNNDEVGDLAASFNEMAVSLKEHIETVTQITAEKERVSAELGVAAKLQADMLPKNFPKRNDFEIYATMTPAREMGGDFYDFFMIDDDHLGLVMADVSGKGIPAAMFMIVAKTLMKIRTTAPGTPSQMLRDINNTLCADNPSQLFVTAWFGILTLSSGELTYSNAGHEYPALMHKGGDYTLIEDENMPPLATVEELEYNDVTVDLRSGDRLFLYTDGVPEAKNSDGQRFSAEKMLEALNRGKDKTPEELLRDIKNEVDIFTGDNDPFDDITMMSFVWKGK